MNSSRSAFYLAKYNKDRKNKYAPFLGILLPAFLLSCSQKIGFERPVVPVKRYDVEIKKSGCAVIRTLYSDIYIEHLDHKKWKKIIDSKIYYNEKFNHEVYRIPKLTFFQIGIKNTSKEPLLVDNIKIKYGNTFISHLTIDELKKYTKSVVYKIIKYERLLSYRRLLSDKYCSKDLNHDRDTISFDFNFIPPSDSVLVITAFEWIPVEIREYKLIIEFDNAGIKRSVGFEVKREEYRTRGKYFRKPKKQKKEFDP